MSEPKPPVLDRSGLINNLISSVKEVNNNILLAGPWGAGKTVILKELGNRASTELNDYHVFKYSPWDCAADGDAGQAFLRALYDELKQAKNNKGGLDKGGLDRIDGYLDILFELLKDDDVREALGLLIPGGKALAVIGGGLGKLIRRLVGNENSDSGGSGINGARNSVSRMLKDICSANGKSKILLLVDDLDRALPEEALTILDGLYHLFLPHAENSENWPLCSVWAVNTSVLEEFLYREYRELPSFDPAAYLEKLFVQRINVPPLFYVQMNSDAENESERLWSDEISKFGNIRIPDELSRILAENVNYAVLGNLRLHARLRRDCLRLWRREKISAPLKCTSLACYVRQARLLALVCVFPAFRERIVPYNGMWPVFLNQLNRRFAERSIEWIANPLYRHLDSPDLATLLQDLGVIKFVVENNGYRLINEGRTKLQQQLNCLWEIGV